MGTVVAKEPCPICREEGRDSRGDNLHVYDDGGKFCHAGHGRIKTMTETKRVEHKVTLLDCMDNPVGADPDRLISPDIAKHYSIRFACDTMTGKIKRLYYPYRDDTGNVVGCKVRLKDTKDFFVVGKLSGVFGKPTAKNPKGALLITEGEEDVLALKEILSKTSYFVNDVVSLPNGANVKGDLDKDTMGDIDFFQKYKTIILCLDTDAPGKATAKRMAEWLVGFIPTVKIANLPMKDASECLVNGKQAEVIDSINNASKFCPEGVIHGSEISITDLLRGSPVGFDTPYAGFNEKYKGVRKGEILTVCAASGIGKSTFVTEIAYDMVVRHNLSVCHIALEKVLEETAAQYVAMDNDVPAAHFRADPSVIPVSDIETSMDRTVRKMYFFKHFGSIDSAAFRNKLMYYARSGVDFIILDHLSMVISGSDVVNERKEIDKIMTDLASMVVETGVGLISVVHLKRRETGTKERGLNEGGQISLTDLRGSAALEQLSWGVVAIERNQQADDGSEDYCYLRILKNRTWGRLGKAGRIKYEHKTGRLIDSPEEVTHEEPIFLSTPEEEVEKLGVAGVLGEGISSIADEVSEEFSSKTLKKLLDFSDAQGS